MIGGKAINKPKQRVGTFGISDETTRIMGCATMWHESSEEMIEMIKSLFRIDEDYSARLYNVHRWMIIFVILCPNLFCMQVHSKEHVQSHRS